MNSDTKTTKLIVSLQQFIQANYIGKRIVVGTLNLKKIYIIVNRQQRNNKIYNSLSIATKYVGNSPKSNEFTTKKMSAITAHEIFNVIHNELGDNFKRLEVDVYRSSTRRTRATTLIDAHLVKPKNAKEIQESKLERQIFKNPKLWKFKKHE